MTDGWYHEFRIVSHKDGKNTDYQVISAGPDGKFGTIDDIAYPRQPAGGVPAVAR